MPTEYEQSGCLLGGLLPQNTPGDIRPQLLAANASSSFNGRAVLSGHVAPRLPHAREALGHRDGCSKRRDASCNLDGFFQRGFGGRFDYHDCDCARITNVLQGGGLITSVKSKPKIIHSKAFDQLETLADRLIWARERKMWTQEKLAQESGVTQGTIGNIEANLRQRPRGLLAIADALGVSPTWLETGEGSPDVVVIDGQHRLFGLLKSHGLDAIVKGSEELQSLAGEALSGETSPGELDDPVAHNDNERRLLRAFRRILEVDRDQALTSMEKRRGEVAEIAKQFLMQQYKVKGALTNEEVEDGFRRAHEANGRVLDNTPKKT